MDMGVAVGDGANANAKQFVRAVLGGNTAIALTVKLDALGLAEQLHGVLEYVGIELIAYLR